MVLRGNGRTYSIPGETGRGLVQTVYINRTKWDVATAGQVLAENQEVAKVMVDVVPADATD